MSAAPVSFGWIMQPALFETPGGIDPRDSGLARQLVAANERHVELARAAGFDTVWVEDHMGWGDKAHLECLTNLAWLAGRHPGLRYGTMVCGLAFRNPAYLAKVAGNLHLLTEGNFILGLGAGNNGAEHAAFGYPFPSAGERLRQMEEAIRVIRALWTDSPATVRGRHHGVEGAFCSPRPDRPIPLLIGGGGERRTLRLVARYADWWCADAGPVEVFGRKRTVLAAHCAAVGRDPGEIVHSQVAWISVEEDPARVVRWPGLHIVAGTPDDVAHELMAFRDAGVRHFQVRFMDYPSMAGFERFVGQVLPSLQEGR